jgi:hypothetical protein
MLTPVKTDFLSEALHSTPRSALLQALLGTITLNYCSLISTSTPAGKSSFINASTVLSVGSTISIKR